MIWLRAETKTQEARTALTPDVVRQLCNSGVELMVERSLQRAIDDASYEDTGCTLVESGAWCGAPGHAYILGLKELPEEDTPLSHRHIYFGHAYKNQHGWRELLARFSRGGGELLDLEYLLDENGRRIAAFGFWAGFTGCAVGIKTWIGHQLGSEPVISTLEPYSGKDSLLEELRLDLASAINVAGHSPTTIIIGAKGRVGAGANQLAQALGLEVTLWDMEETARGGPFSEILEHDIFINCVLVQKKIPPFLTMESLSNVKRRLSMITDVSCDPGECNPIPVYTEATSFSAPVVNVVDAEHPLYLCAIDHLPSLLPVESSEDFARQLLPHLLTLNDDMVGVWQHARQLFHEKSSNPH
jgi:saccharopine dehydrogenase (NAD+, L-lysine-forming)